MPDVEPASAPNDIVSRLLRVLDNFTDLLHDKVMRPITLIGRTIAYGFIIVVVGATTLILALIFAKRFLDIYAFSGHQWITFVIIGTVMVLVGLWVWRRRRPQRLRK